MSKPSPFKAIVFTGIDQVAVQDGVIGDAAESEIVVRTRYTMVSSGTLVFDWAGA